MDGGRVPTLGGVEGPKPASWFKFTLSSGTRKSDSERKVACHVPIGSANRTQVCGDQYHTLIVRDIQRSVAFYRDVLGATVLRAGEPTFLRLGNIWLTINDF
jgi:hypothetical protein